MTLRFTRREIFDLLVAWLALGVAFTVFLDPGLVRTLANAPEVIDPSVVAVLFGVSLATAGVGFLLHELAHKVVAVRFGQVAGFRADYGMLVLAILGALVGFLFAAPGAVYHRGRVSKRQRGLIALAGPVTNLLLAIAFFGLLLAGPGQGSLLAGLSQGSLLTGPGQDSLLAAVGSRGLLINLLLAGFNMIPFGPLDGRTVLQWNVVVFAVAFVLTAGPAVAILFGLVP